MDDLFYFEQKLTPDVRLIKDTVADFVKNEVEPLIVDAFENGYFPDILISKLADLGLFGINIPSEYGGLDASYMAYGVVCQELERGDSGLRSFVSVQNSLCMYPIFRYGTEQQKQRFLQKMAHGTCIGCFGLTESHSGSDPASMKTYAQSVEGGYILNGAKLWITNATIADIAIVWAKTEAGVAGFIVEKDMTGFQSAPIEHKMSLRASITGELIFQDVFIPLENKLNCSGLSAPLSCLNQARYGIAWGAVGAAMDCFERAQNYVLSRSQFGKPLASFQLIQQVLADHYTELMKLQALNLQLAYLKDQHLETPPMISLVKRDACRQALKIARSCRDLLGANGISLEYHVIRHMLNLESVVTYEGTDHIHTLVLGKYLTGIDAFK